MPSGTPPRPTLALLLGLSVAAVGCVPRTIDAEQLERRLGRELSQRLGIAGIVATCPDGVEVQKGATSTCTARGPREAVALRVVVTQLDDDGNVSWEIAGAAE